MVIFIFVGVDVVHIIPFKEMVVMIGVEPTICSVIGSRDMFFTYEDQTLSVSLHHNIKKRKQESNLQSSGYEPDMVNPIPPSRSIN
jgi:hypothetical protein